MLVKTLLITGFAYVSAALQAHAATSFAGSNLYYAAGLSASEAEILLSGMESAGMKVLRVWLDGESDANTKNTSITAYPSLEPTEIGVYNDTVLNLLDDFMLRSRAHGIKLMISMHSWNALSGGDVYNTIFGTEGFYELENATTAFDNRLRHVLNHEHSLLKVPWKKLSEFIFAFEAENEAMIGLGQEYIEDHQSWQYDRATTIKNELGQNSGILVTTGGESFLDESVQPEWLTCDAIDIVAIHAYGVGDLDTTKIQAKVSLAQAAGTKLIFQEWGACYYNTSNNLCPTGGVLATSTRNTNIEDFAGNITAAGVPWMYWQILPNADPHFGADYEIGAFIDPSWEILKKASLDGRLALAAFDYSEYLL